MAKLLPTGMPYLGRVGNTLAKPTQKGYISVQQYDPQLYNPTSSEKQMAVRARFRELTKIAHSCPDEIFAAMTKKGATMNMSGRNLFVKENWDNVRAQPGTSGSTTTNWPELQWNPWGINAVTFSNLSFAEALTISVNIANTDMRWPQDAKVGLLAICPEADAAMMSDPVSASAASITMPVPTGWNGRRAYVYGFTVTNETPLDQTTNIEGANYAGGLVATTWGAIFSTNGRWAMSKTIFIGQGGIN